MLPEFLIETIKLADGRRIQVIRDDIVPGGSKQRALELMLQRNHTYVYPAPAYGFAQIALALAAKRVGARAVIFVAKRKHALHDRTLRAKRAGAKIIEVPFGMLTVVAKRARDYAAKQSGASALLSGFDSPEFIDTMTRVIEDDRALRRLKPERVWCCVGTGALARAMQQAWPRAQFEAVRTGMRPNVTDMRVYEAPEAYAKPAKIKPPFSSCSNSDAKVWRFILAHASDGDVFWNVAGD